MESKFFTFIKPYLLFIDNGNFFRKPFSWLYILLAVLNLILPIYLLYKAIDNNVFDAPSKFVIVFILIWLIIVFVSWISFQLWWDRKQKVMETSTKVDEFLASPVFSHFIQTLGEWIGTWVGVVGSLTALLATIILGDDAYSLSVLTGIDFLKSGYTFIVLMIVYGFLIIVISRFIAEQFRALAVIANNTNNNNSQIKTEANSPQNCSQCGAPIKKDSKFCAKCGNKL